MSHRKPNLPEKTCVVCERPFSWRKKWKRVWEQVKYCSDDCRRARRAKSADSTACSSGVSIGQDAAEQHAAEPDLAKRDSANQHLSIQDP